MSDKLQRLELVWPGKNERVDVEPRILIEDAEKSYSADPKIQEKMNRQLFEQEPEIAPTFDNMLIHGDNLLALKALEAEYSGKVKCIYIDPPYNTGNAFEHYDDGYEHSIWLSLMRDRLEILKNLLANDGFIFIQIDNNECCYLKILCDEIFGRNNFVNDILWKRRGGSANPNNRLNNVTDYILWYSKSQEYEINYIFSLDDENTQEYIKKRFNNIEEKTGRRFMKSPIQSPNPRPTLTYDYKGYKTPKNGYSISLEVMKKWDEEGKLCFPQSKSQNINRKIYLDEYKGQPINNLWTDIKVINPMSKERSTFDGGQKPEALIERILTLATKPGDLVLDSFLGSGTTAAVAHKMGRRWIGIEMGDHIYSHCLPRLKRVIDCEDAGGITHSAKWQGGGGFKFYELGSTLIVTDKHGRQVISDKYNPEMLAEAMCKLMGYKYAPDKENYWKQGYSSEKNFIFTTTMNVEEQLLAEMSQALGDGNLLICCGAFTGNKTAYDNITVKKIPQAILKKCQWGSAGYPLPIREDFSDGDFEFEDEE